MDIWSPRLEGARFLDLFAGSGAVGIEAVSRGAASLVLVEAEAHVIRQLNETCRNLDLQEAQVQAARLPGDPAKSLPNLSGKFDLIFADPPYAFDEYGELLEAIAGWLAPNGEIAVEHESRRQLPESCRGLLRVDQRKYGDSTLSFYSRDPETQD
jgi:16S rRNA (guanine966-N2)-methyltransferase